MWDTLFARPTLEVKHGEFRELTAKEKTSVVADCRMQDFEGAFNRYVRFAYDYPDHIKITNPREFAADSPELFSKASWFVFETLNAG